MQKLLNELQCGEVYTKQVGEILVTIAAKYTGGGNRNPILHTRTLHIHDTAYRREIDVSTKHLTELRYQGREVLVRK